MAGRPKKFRAGSSGRHSSGGGNNLMALLGGSDISAMEPGDVDYRDDSFDANDYSQTRYEPTHSVLNFLSGGTGSNYASSLNDATNLRNANVKIQQAKALELQDFQNKKMIEQINLTHNLAAKNADAASKLKIEESRQEAINKVLGESGVIPDKEGFNAKLYDVAITDPAIQETMAKKLKLTSDYNKSLAQNADAEILRPILQKSALANAQFEEANSGALNNAKLMEALLKPKLTQADINVKEGQAKEIYGPGGWGPTYNKQTGERAGDSTTDALKDLLKPAASISTPAQPNATSSLLKSATSFAPSNLIQSGMSFFDSLKNKLLGNKPAPVAIPNTSLNTNVNAPPISISGPPINVTEQSYNTNTLLNAVYTKDALGNVYKNGILQKKKTTTASPAIAP